MLGLVARMILPGIWPDLPCSFDECSYDALAERIRAGAGMTPTQQWLWAPGYPYLIAAVQALSGGHASIHDLQIVLALCTIAMTYMLARSFAGVRCARLAALISALHPTFIFYTSRTWSEPVFSAALLALVLATLWSRRGGWARALLPGSLLGASILLRGMASYFGPIVLIAVLWPEARFKHVRWLHGLVVTAVAICAVLPYSISASQRHGGFVLSDATLGRMMWLGNNTFPPISYDFGNGIPLAPRYQFPARPYRPSCDSTLSPVALNDCEVENGLAWIRSHPAEFLSRVPYRAAQLLNPNSFLTRHLRTEKYPGMPGVLIEILSVWVVFTSLIIILGGAVGAATRIRDATGLLPLAIVLLYMAAICMLAGLTRYRVAWEPFAIVYAAAFLADPRESWRRARASRIRVVGVVVSLALLLPLTLWFLPAGFPAAW